MSVHCIVQRGVDTVGVEELHLETHAADALGKAVDLQLQQSALQTPGVHVDALGQARGEP